MNSNPHGFLRFQDGVLVEDSQVSVFGSQLGSGYYTCPVPGRNDLRYRINAVELMNLTPEQAREVVEKAQALYPLKPKRLKNDAPTDEARGEDNNG